MIRWKRGVCAALGLSIAVLLLGARPASTAAPRGAASATLVDLIETDIAYTTIAYDYRTPLHPQRLLDGARVGIVAYLRGHGVARPRVAYLHAQPDGRGAVPAIEHQIGLAIVRYGRRVTARGLVYAAIDGELEALHDPYSVLFTPAQLHGFQSALDGRSFGGVGIALAYDDATRSWHADGVFPGSPAAGAGVRPGDVLVSANGTPLAGRAGSAVAALLRGPVGSEIALDVLRDGAPLPAPLRMRRAPIVPPDVTSHLVAAHVGYVMLRGFPLDAAAQVRRAFTRLAEQGARGFVFDLRGNGGGYESAAVAVASLFIARGAIAINEARGGQRRVYEATGDVLPRTPLVVLVDGDSASGAELVAAALQDRHVATLVGTRTFGKGVAQTMFPLPDGAALKLTTARYLTAGGRSIDRVGVEPDIVVDESRSAETGLPGRDPQLDRALQLLSAGPPSSPRQTGTRTGKEVPE